MIKSAKEVANLIETNLGIHNFHYRLMTSNPMVPYLYALPKIHKEENKKGPIEFNISISTEKLVGWLVNEFNKMPPPPPPPGNYVENTIEFVNKVKNTIMRDNEAMVSFDVRALYRNVPVEIAIECMVKQNGIKIKRTKYRRRQDKSVQRSS